MPRRILWGVALLAVAVTGAGTAQVTGVPSYQAPYRAFERHEFGGTLSFGEGVDFGLEGQYRIGVDQFDIGFRGGILEPEADLLDTRVLLGVDVRQRVITHSEDFPLDGAVVFGIGAQLADDPDPAPGSTLIVPAGISVGRRLDVEDSQISIIPYVQPTLFLTANGDTDLNFALGLGADVRLSRMFDLRVSGSLGDLEGIALSAVWVR